MDTASAYYVDPTFPVVFNQGGLGDLRRRDGHHSDPAATSWWAVTICRFRVTPPTPTI